MIKQRAFVIASVLLIGSASALAQEDGYSNGTSLKEMMLLRLGHTIAQAEYGGSCAQDRSCQFALSKLKNLKDSIENEQYGPESDLLMHLTLQWMDFNQKYSGQIMTSRSQKRGSGCDHYMREFRSCFPNCGSDCKNRANWAGCSTERYCGN